MYQVLNVTPPALRRVNPAVPDELDFTIARALEKNVAQRYQRASEMAAELRAAQEALKEKTRVLDRGDFQGETWPLESDAAEAATVVQPAAPDDAKTWALRPGQAVEPGSTTQRTVRLEVPQPPVAGEDVALTTDAPFSPSIDIPSDAAIARLGSPSAADRKRLAPPAEGPGRLRAWLRDRDTLAAAGTIIAAMVVAVALVVL
jgi:hypothetical protein